MSDYINPTAIRDAYRIVEEMQETGRLSEGGADILLNALKPIPAQMSWDELRDYIQEGYYRADVDGWAGDKMLLEAWMEELLCQYDGLKSLPAKPAYPALPAGMRLAEHDVHGLCVVSPKSDRQGLCVIMYLRDTFSTKADWAYEHESKLKFIDVEPAKPEHPEFLETEADYANAPVGTIVAKDNQRPAWKPNENWFINNNPFDNREMAGGFNPAPSRVLRWGLGE